MVMYTEMEIQEVKSKEDLYTCFFFVFCFFWFNFHYVVVTVKPKHTKINK